MASMFWHCYKLITIKATSTFSTETTKNVTNSAEMFAECTSISGGFGQKYDENYIDKTYATPDTGVPGNRGYFYNPNF